ncbi:outer membrane protein assembly factor BamB family protein [Novipirellula artificiosorum]|uniref:Outer membrane biogenesis protein BamB n=1 Tax=Novipirellula artificiosorum TaxID=2528016 RepID=A0A5C6D4X5_9BACT|nr:PQQ-binding-like beta-propeller repeat protein [Novipirellula artificiosorum]TWU32193.1 outer membrane biogenesis protein BamB [Novipirellula artificiosorum]
MNRSLTFALLTLCLSLFNPSNAADWPRFRGSDGDGMGTGSAIPLTWSETQNMAWRTPLPGPGSSSPVVWGDRVFVTCYSGYGVAGKEGGSKEQLQRHLICVKLSDGKILWQKTVPAEMPEDESQGYITEHGYASSSPVTDGEQVFVFFGKTGVLAFDLEGNEQWRVDVGKESSNRRWGSAASPVLYKKMVIVNASEESRAIIALDKKTGREVWKAEADTLELAYGTPLLVELPDATTELVISVPGEVWGLNPDTGKLRWFAETNLTGNICPSVIAKDGIVYTFGGYRSAGSHAIRAGGKDDVTDTHMVWSSRESSYVATPLLHEEYLYWIDDRGQAHCLDAKTGESVYRERVRDLSGSGRPVYASPVLVGDRLYVVSRYDGTFVLPAKPSFEILSTNRFESDESDSSGTPAITGDRMVLRSGRYLYCVSDN